jgi:hypothetical protein
MAASARNAPRDRNVVNAFFRKDCSLVAGTNCLFNCGRNSYRNPISNAPQRDTHDGVSCAGYFQGQAPFISPIEKKYNPFIRVQYTRWYTEKGSCDRGADAP